MTTKTLLATFFLLLTAVILTACGADAPEPTRNSVSASVTVNTAELTAPTMVPTQSASSNPTLAPTETADSLRVRSLDDVRRATVRVGVKGTYVDMEHGWYDSFPNHGTGFIIDPSGIAVTNNHVVAGASIFEIAIDGENEPRSARLLGVSECADLAVIDIEGDGFPYLSWYDGEVRAGQVVYAAGFPEYGNTTYTLTKGVVSKESANGETQWASVDNIIVTDATIIGGNSGGPLVTEHGQVVAVNYGGLFDAEQGYSIAQETALAVVDELRQGKDIDSIGLNGEAVTDYDSFSGIWVASVASGTVADQSGIRPGDLLVKLEGVTLGRDGTLADYCDILRSRDPASVMAIEVWRLETGEVLQGQLNGDPLEVVASLGGEPDSVAETTVIPTRAPGPGNVSIHNALWLDLPNVSLYDEYQTYTDSTNTLTFDYPAEWPYVSTEDGGYDEFGVFVTAGGADPATVAEFSPDIPMFVLVGRSTAPVDEATTIDFEEVVAAQCLTRAATFPYHNPTMGGTVVFFTGCGEQQKGNIIFVSGPTHDGAAEVTLVATVWNTADAVVTDRLLNSLIVNAP